MWGVFVTVVFFASVVWSGTIKAEYDDQIQIITERHFNDKVYDSELEQYIKNAELRFSVKWAQQLVHDFPDQNFIVSPFSIYHSLAILYEGALNQTKVELEVALGLPHDSTVLVMNFLNKIRRILKSGERWNSNLVIASAIFVQEGYHFKDQFREQIIAGNSDVKIRYLDFSRWQSILFINQWISDKSRGHFTQPYDKLLEVNTAFTWMNVFNYDTLWANEFDKQWTKKAYFTTKPGGLPVVVDMMHSIQRVPYYRSSTNGYTAIGLPYADKSFVMYFVQPNDAHCPLATLIENLTAAELGSVMRESLQRRRWIDYKIPRVEFSWRKNLNAQLRNLGIRSALKNDSANFGNIFEDADVYLYSFGHTSNIKISEDGLVHNARMITLISEGEQGSSKNEVLYSFVLDRPFLVILYHSVTNAILSYGAVYNPLG